MGRRRHGRILWLFTGHHARDTSDMLNSGLLRRAYLETRWTTLVFGVCVLLISTLLHFALPRFQKNLEAFQLPAARLTNLNNIRNAMLGADVSNAGGREIAAGVAWSHPFFLALIFAQVITVCTRVPAAELDRGTMDVLLGLPVSRSQLYFSETAVCLATSAVVVGLAVAGSRIGNAMAPAGMAPDLPPVLIIAVNLLLLNAAVGAFAMGCSAVLGRRMHAVAAVLIVVVGSLLINYLRLLWEPARHIAFLSILDYYRPIIPLRDGHWPWKDMAVLGGTSLALWAAAGAWFFRRDLSTT